MVQLAFLKLALGSCWLLHESKLAASKSLKEEFELPYDAFLELRASEHSYDAFLGISHP